MYLSTACVLITSFFMLSNVPWTQASFKERDKMLYKDLGTLYFSPGEKTRARRTYSVPQLICLHGCQYPQPKMVQCTNTGWDGSSNLWKCKSDLDSKFTLDKPEVVCEGYNSPDDAYVTAGSCSLEYSVKPRKSGNEGGTEITSLFFFAFCAFLIFVLYKTCLRPDNERVHQNSFTNDNGPDDGQGPQMGWNIPGMNQRHRPGNTPGFGFAPQTDTCGNQGNMGGRGGGGGGFWTGLATGGMLGYMLGGNRNRNTGYGYSSMPSPSYDFGGGYANRRSSGLFSSEDASSSTSESVSTARYRQR